MCIRDRGYTVHTNTLIGFIILETSYVYALRCIKMDANNNTIYLWMWKRKIEEFTEVYICVTSCSF